MEEELALAVKILEKYIIDVSGGGCDYVNEGDLEEAKQEKAFIESFNFEILRKNLLEKLDIEIQEIEEALS